MTDRKRAAIYVRISKEEQSEHSLDNQLERCQAMIKVKGWAEAGVYRDNGKGGTTMNRPGIQDLLAVCRAGEVDAIVTDDLTRFGRNAREVLNAVYDLKDLGVEFVAVRDSIDTSTDVGRLVLTVLAGIAQFDNERRSAKIAAGAQARIAKGGGWAKAPFGYTRTLGVTPAVYLLVADEVVDVRKVFALRFAGGTMQAIADTMNVSGKVTGKRWYPSTVRLVLKHEDTYRHGRDGMSPFMGGNDG